MSAPTSDRRPSGLGRLKGRDAVPDLARLFRWERPLPPTPASRRLRRLILLTALATVAVEVISLATLDEAGFGLAVRTGWATLRVIGWLALMRAVRFGRGVSRPLGLILSVTTVFAVARLVEPRSGDPLPEWPVLAGLAVLIVLCATVVWRLYRSPAVAAHLTGRPVRRHIPGWVLTARIAALAETALLTVPFLVAVGSVLGGEQDDVPFAVALLEVWLVLAVATIFVVPWGSFFVVVGKSWARWGVGLWSTMLLVVQPLLCYALLGLDGLIRDGAPLVITVLLCLYALHRSRGLRTFYRPDPATGAGDRVTDYGP